MKQNVHMRSRISALKRCMVMVALVPGTSTQLPGSSMSSPAIGVSVHPSRGIMTPSGMAPVAVSPQSLSEEGGLENAGRLVDQHMKDDHSFRELSGQLMIPSHRQTNCTGYADSDYPCLDSSLPALSNLPLLNPDIHHVPLPPELIEEFQNMQCNCTMGLLPEINRAWLVIDSNIYVWNYENGRDLAYFDGLNEVILSAGLVLPKTGVFQDHIQFLLCLTTAVEIVILGVSFTATPTDSLAEMHLQPEPLFSLPTDNVGMLDIQGTPEGRIFLGGKDGCLYEVVYQAEDGWFSRKCKKVNHSISMLSFMVPSFLSFSEEDPLIQLLVDSSRQILYTRSKNNTITVYDMGREGKSLSRIASMSMSSITHMALSALRTNLRNLVNPLVKLSVIPTSESSTLHLLAVTQAGIRLYFTTTPDGVVARPSLLALVHVRLPPGYTPTNRINPSTRVHQAYYRKGSLVLSISQTEEKDMLWIVDPDLFPFKQTLVESHYAMPLNGRTWAIAESIEPGELEDLSSPIPLPPAVVSEHAQLPRRFILLTTQGSYMFTKLRPVDQLQWLLDVCKSGGGEAIEGFFKLHHDVEACTMCLILATGPNQQYSSWATEAFFKYGGEPHFIFPTTVGPATQLDGAPSIQGTPTFPLLGQRQVPSMAPLPQTLTPQYGARSTPAMQQTPTLGGVMGGALGGALIGPEVKMSGKHNGLYRYLARLLRPVWNEPVVICVTEMNTDQFISRYQPGELTVFLEQLVSLRSFLERNPKLFATASEKLSSVSPSNVHHRLLNFMRPESMPTDSPADVHQSLLNKYKADAYNQELNSLHFLYLLVVRCCECVSLWKLLCDYQLHLTVTALGMEDKMQLLASTFRTVVLSGRKLTSSLISTLLNRYAGDVGMSDSLSARLLEGTPTLFSQDDAIASKAQELVTRATGSKSKYEQLSLLRESVKRFSKVTHLIPLPTVCNEFINLHYHEGIVELVLSSAAQIDPQNLGLHYYKSNQPPTDVVGHGVFMERLKIYATITETLKRLLEKQLQPVAPSSAVPTQPGPPPAKPEEEETPDPRKEFDDMVILVLRSDDELLHVTLYSWFISEGMADKLVEIQSPYVEEYLKHTAAIQRDNCLILDLLWRYYERQRNYATAARILDQLAHREGHEFTLDARIEYLSRAVMCAKSCNLTTSASKEGEFLHELEEKMEVARIQLSLLESLQLLPTSVEGVSEAASALNTGLKDITTLYGDFAEPFHLAECKLAIVHCAGHYDPTLICSLWREIINNEFRSASGSDAQKQSIRSKLTTLGATYAGSERFFPLEYIVQLMEQHSCNKGWGAEFVYEVMLEISVSVRMLFVIYDKMFKAKDSSWESVQGPLHILDVIHSLLKSYVNTSSSNIGYERQSFNVSILDAISSYLMELQSMSSGTPGVSYTTSNFRSLEAQIKRLA